MCSFQRPMAARSTFVSAAIGAITTWSWASRVSSNPRRSRSKASNTAGSGRVGMFLSVTTPMTDVRSAMSAGLFEWLQPQAGEPRDGRLAPILRLQFRSATPDAAHESGDGRWRHQQALRSVGSSGATRSRRVKKSGIAEQGMDLKTYFQLFWVPAIASAALMALLWLRMELSGRAPLFLASCFLLALAAQYLGTITSVLWVVGLVLQTTLATFLLLKHQLGQL